MAISQSTLRSKASTYYEPVTESMRRADFSRKKSAFLCHSHKDQKLVKGLIVIFQEAGVDLYIDWQDQSMPPKPSKATAQKIQRKIMGANLFLFLATANSKSSRWCPWEIGYADSGNKNIYIIPTRDDNNSYGNEYLGLYKKIDEGKVSEIMKGYAVFQPGSKQGHWLSERTLDQEH